MLCSPTLINNIIAYIQTMNRLVLIVAVSCAIGFHLFRAARNGKSISTSTSIRSDAVDEIQNECKEDDQSQSLCPELQRLESLVNFFEVTRNWPVLVEVGDAYARGCYPFYGADPSTATRIYHLASR